MSTLWDLSSLTNRSFDLHAGDGPQAAPGAASSGPGGTQSASAGASGGGQVAAASLPAVRREAILSTLADPVDVWHTSDQPRLTMTYQFESSQPDELWHSYSGWTAFTSAQKETARSVFAEFASVIDVRFVEVRNSDDPDINLGRINTSHGGLGSFRYFYFTDGFGNVTSKTLDGYAVFNNTLDLTSPNGRHLLLHEIGHALTLRHPGNYDSTGNPPPPPYLPASVDNNRYTVMSYNLNPDTGLRTDHLMLYDIAALQYRFGANTSTHKGNDTYTEPSDPTEVIWDAAGTDRINAAAQSDPVAINLRDGTFSSVGARNNLAIAYGVVIEHAIGGSGNDRLYGNSGNNSLQGRAGNDRLSGSSGNDALKGGAGRDFLDGSAGIDTADYRDKSVAVSLTLKGSSNAVAKVDGATEDTVRNVENVYGGSGADTLTGDSLANFIRGGGGKDKLHGGTGIDTADYADKSGTVQVTLNGGTNVAVRINGTIEDTIRSFENVNGGSRNDKLTGDIRINVINGNAGNDTINGGGGNDRLFGGSGHDTVNGGASNDSIKGGTGVDKLYGSTGNDKLYGETGIDRLYGGSGDDFLVGGRDRDTLAGESGRDTFLFDAALSSINIDTIVGYSVASDTIRLENAIFKTLIPTGTLAANLFFAGAAANDADDRIVYNPSTGALFYDFNGNGAGGAIQFAKLSGALALTNLDFIVV
ncbi:MAG: M10 family metallopeptidase C-terminal domain-containing protein [Xanthobacteraceae bacterium]